MTVSEAREYVGALRRTNQYRKSQWYVVIARGGSIVGFCRCRTYTEARRTLNEQLDGDTQAAIVNGAQA